MLINRTLSIVLFLCILLLGVFFVYNENSAIAQNEFKNYCEQWYKDKVKGKYVNSIADYQDSILQLEWPDLGTQGGNINNNIDDISLGGLVNYFYSLSLWLSILIAFISILYVGFEYIASGQAPARRKIAQERIKNIFIGILILLCSVIILNLINPDFNKSGFCYEEGTCREEVDNNEDQIILPRSGTNLLGRNQDNKYQKGIPYSSADSVSYAYKDVKIASSGNCYSCSGEKEKADNEDEKFEICNASCKKNVLHKSENEDEYRIVGLDRLKCYLDYKTENSEKYSSWAIVGNSDDNAVLACVGACSVIATDRTVDGSRQQISCPNAEYTDDERFPNVDEDIFTETAIECEESATCLQLLKYSLSIRYEDADGEGLGAIRKFVCKALGCKDKDDGFHNSKFVSKFVSKWSQVEDKNGDWYDGKLNNFKNGWIFWGNTNSPDKNALKIHDEGGISRAKLRACITDKYLYDAQDLPSNILGNNAKLCLCKDPRLDN